MESKKINQLATNVAPQTSDLTIIGDPITGVSKKITLLQIANLFATTGTVTSVGITETGNALTITGSPITSAGTINIGFAGDATQYVRGDGALADFPTSTGGGSSVSYYLNSSVSQGTIGGVDYREFSKDPIAGAGTDITISADGYIASYITDANDPALLEVPGGNFNCEFYFSVNSNAHNPYVYAELYKYDGTTFTLLGSSQSVPEYLTNGTTLSPYYFAVPVATAALTITDRLAIRIYANVDTRTVTLHTENNHLCQVVTTFSKGLTSLNNLTRQVQFLATGTSGTDFNISSSTATHTFNLPVASATNTGKLSSTDWSTFNAKQPAIGYTPANDSLVVHLAGSETITGDKTFDGNNVYNGVNTFNTYQTRFSLGIAINQTLSGGAVSSHTVIGANVNGLNVNFPAGGYNSLNFASTSVSNTYTFPNATGTLALTSQLTSGTVTSVGLSSATSGVTIGSSPITTSGTITLAIATASGSQNGLLSSTDWTTFNNKQNALTNPITGTGTTSYVPKFTASGTIGNSIIYDLGTRIAIGGTSAADGVLTVQSDSGQFCIQSNTTPGKQLQIGYDHVSNNSYLSSLNQGVAFTTLALQPNGGNVHVGGSTSNGAKLQVTGAATISSSVSINTTNAYGKFQTKVATDANLYLTNYNAGEVAVQFTNDANSLQCKAQFLASQFAFMGGGNVGIGTSSPNSLGSGANQLVVGNGSSTQGLTIYTGSTSDANIYFANGTSGSQVYNGAIVYNHSSNYMIFATNGGTERMRITSGGFVEIKQGADTASDGFGLRNIAAGNLWSMVNGGDSNLYFIFNGGLRGQINLTTGVYTPLSDKNKKKDFEDSKIGLNAIMGLKPTLYRMKTDETEGSKELGFIAQEVREFIPQAYIENDNEDKFIGLNYNAIVAALVKSVQEQQVQIEELKAKIK